MSSHLDADPPQDEIRAEDEDVPLRDDDVPPTPPPVLPDITPPNLDLDLSIILGASSVEAEKVQKRASNVMKLSQENEKLKAELKAMTDRLEAAERRRAELARKEHKPLESLRSTESSHSS